MSKNWSLVLIMAFVLGFGTKSYFDSQKTLEQEEMQSASGVTLYGEKNQAVNIFDTSDKRIRIVYFGFTRCPDVCPTSLAMLAGALNQIDDETKKQLRPMFVSLDPERDDAESSATYAHYFHATIEGLSGSLDITTSLANRYGVIFVKPNYLTRSLSTH